MNKKQKYFKILKYAGSKYRFLDLILPLIEKSKKNNYIEPFLGSGSIFLNLNHKNFNCFILNDKSKYIYETFNMFKEINFQFVQNFYNQKIIKQFGNIGQSKQLYYQFREYVNGLQENTLEKQLGIFYLARSCINGLVRWNQKTGNFNQGFGNRGRDIFLTKQILNEIQFLLNKNKVLLMNKDYLQLQQFLNQDNLLWILDPPYCNKSMTYKNQQYNFEQFFEFVKKIKGDLIYFDTQNQKANQFFKNDKIVIRQMKSVAPSNKDGKHNKNVNEMIYFKIRE